MILTTTEELNALLPANVSTRPDRLLTLAEQTERTHIIPLLGRPLYDAVCQEYDKLHTADARDTNGEVMDANSLVATESHHLGYQYTPMQQLIRLLQVPLVYMTLANNVGILSISLNDAGMNIVSAESYDAARKEDREAFSRDCFHNAHKGMEQVLLFLEEDAHSFSPQFLKLWSQSPSFYMQYGLLVPSATLFNQIVPIDDSREVYLSLVQRIRYVQDSKVRTELGERLTDALIQYAAFGPQSSEASERSNDANAAQPNSELITQNSQLINPFSEDLRPYLPVQRYPGMTTEQRIKLNGWNRLLLFLRQAVCFYVEMDSKKLRRAESERDALLSVERAKQFVINNTALFEGVVEDSPLYTHPGSPSATPPCKGGQGDVTFARKSPGGVFDPLGGYYS